MARSKKKSHPGFGFSGEVWTDGRGLAMVIVPAAAEALAEAGECELGALIGGGQARLASELADGRFLIETDEPHVKVAWRLTAKAGRR